MLLLLAACTAGKTETGTTPTTPSSSSLSIENLEVGDCSGDSGVEESLSVSPEAGGKLVVAHFGYAAECCLSFNVSAAADSHTDVILAVYEPVGTPCDCLCHYDFGYRVEGVRSGDWTFEAGYQSQSVHVE